jgi:hypothetical protein
LFVQIRELFSASFQILDNPFDPTNARTAPRPVPHPLQYTPTAQIPKLTLPLGKFNTARRWRARVHKRKARTADLQLAEPTFVLADFFSHFILRKANVRELQLGLSHLFEQLSLLPLTAPASKRRVRILSQPVFLLRNSLRHP